MPDLIETEVPVVCRKCHWNIDMSDCESGGDSEGDHDLCRCPQDSIKVSNIDFSELVTGNSIEYMVDGMVPRCLRCITHRSKGRLTALLMGYCGKRGRWFLEKVEE